MKKGNIYLFLHVPKTAGTTFIKHIKKNLNNDEYLEIEPLILGVSADFDGKKYRQAVDELFSKLSKKQKTRLKIVFGHVLPYGIHKYFEKTPKYFTFLRDPEKRILSTYNYLLTISNKSNKDNKTVLRLEKLLFVNKKLPDFDEWYEKKFRRSRDLVMMDSYDFLHKQGYDLSKFFFIGLTEKFDEDSLFIYKELGFNKFFLNKNVSEKALRELNVKQQRLIRKNHKKALVQYKKAKLISQSYDNNLALMKLKRNFLLPITQTLFDFPEYIHRASSFMRKKSSLYSYTLDFLKERVR